MAQLRNALRAHAFNDLGPAATLTALNRLMELTHASGFATCLYAVLDLTTLTLRWARAGHPPFMVHRGESIEVFERPDDPPIGAVAEFDYREDEVVLQSRDLLLLYTDGLIERRDEIIDVGLDRLARELTRVPNLPVDVLCERLCDAMLPTGPGTDDLCVLALRVP
jgi:serine phosphatase RsbU (regulator of sigma subunit)